MPGEENQVMWRGVQPVSGIRGIWPAIDSERMNLSHFLPATSTAILKTVAAGKLAFISSVSLTTKINTTSSSYAWVLVRDVVDATIITIITHYHRTPSQDSSMLPFRPAIEVPAGYDIFFQTGGGGIEARAGVYGWIEDA